MSPSQRLRLQQPIAPLNLSSGWGSDLIRRVQEAGQQRLKRLRLPKTVAGVKFACGSRASPSQPRVIAQAARSIIPSPER